MKKHKKHYCEEGQIIQFIKNSIQGTINNLADNPMSHRDIRLKCKKTIIDGFKKGRIAYMKGKKHTEKAKRKLHLSKWKESSKHTTYYSMIARRLYEEKLGRKLLRQEVIHHLDHNPSNNNLDNLHLFVSNSEHISYHRMKEYLLINELGLEQKFKNKNWKELPRDETGKFCQI